MVFDKPPGSKVIYPDFVGFISRSPILVPPAGSEAKFSPLLSGLYPTLRWRKVCQALFCEVKGDNEFEFLSSLASGAVFWGLL